MMKIYISRSQRRARQRRCSLSHTPGKPSNPTTAFISGTLLREICLRSQGAEPPAQRPGAAPPVVGGQWFLDDEYSPQTSTRWASIDAVDAEGAPDGAILCTFPSRFLRSFSIFP